jgi:integrase
VKKTKRGNHEGTVFPYKNGWKGAILLGRDPDSGKQIRKWVQRELRCDVVEELKKLKEKHDKGQPIVSKTRTVEEFLNEWLEVHVKATKAASTHRGYEQTARMYLIPVLGRIRLDHLNGKDVQRTLNKISANGLSPTTAKNANAVLKTALTTAKK